MTEQELKNLDGIKDAMLKGSGDPEQFKYEYRKCGSCVLLAQILLDVADTFLADADRILKSYGLKTKGEYHKRINRVRHHIEAVHGIVAVPNEFTFGGSDECVDHNENMTYEIYELLKAYTDHTDGSKGFKSFINCFKRLRLHRHIFER